MAAYHSLPTVPKEHRSEAQHRLTLQDFGVARLV